MRKNRLQLGPRRRHHWGGLTAGFQRAASPGEEGRGETEDGGKISISVEEVEVKYSVNGFIRDKYTTVGLSGHERTKTSLHYITLH